VADGFELQSLGKITVDTDVRKHERATQVLAPFHTSADSIGQRVGDRLVN